MSERATNFMKAVWDARNTGADTEEKLVATILRLVADNVKFYNAQNSVVVLDKNDVLELSNEIEQTSQEKNEEV
jgi:hypothetical protein